MTSRFTLPGPCPDYHGFTVTPVPFIAPLIIPAGYAFTVFLGALAGKDLAGPAPSRPAVKGQHILLLCPGITGRRPFTLVKTVRFFIFRRF
jgi:hypothetical protein